MSGGSGDGTFEGGADGANGGTGNGSSGGGGGDSSGGGGGGYDGPGGSFDGKDAYREFGEFGTSGQFGTSGEFGDFEEEFGVFPPEDVGPPPQVAADIEAISEANEEFYAAAEAGDLDRLGAIWLAGPFEASVQCVHPGWAPVFGREDVLRSWAVVCANTPFLQFFLTDVRIDVVDRIAVVSLTENIITDMSAGSSEDDPGFIAGGRATTVNIFRRTDEGWRLWMHHASAVMESAED